MSLSLEDIADIIVTDLKPLGTQGTSLIRSMAMNMISRYKIPVHMVVSAFQKKGFKLIIGPCTLCYNETVKDSFQACKSCGKSIHLMCSAGEFCDSRCRLRLKDQVGS
jgi:hypothetical protein